MREQNSSKSKLQLQHGSSTRLLIRSDEMNKQIVKNRRSGDFVYRHTSDAVGTTDNNKYSSSNTKFDTLDPVTNDIHHNLRPLLRKIYKQDHLRPVEDNMESGWDTWSRGNITNFGYINTPPQVDVKSYNSLQHESR